MGQKEVIEKSTELMTKEKLVKAFQNIGLNKGMTVIVHSSLSSIGFISGGAQTVVQALMETVGEEGTLVMPTHSADLSDPVDWSEPPVPLEWHETIRDTMPAFDPQLTLTFGMGAIVEMFRHSPGVVRSSHPVYSFAAWGKNKQKIIENHPLDFGLGDGSPLGHLYELNSSILLLGVDYDNNTSMHLAEHRIPTREKAKIGSPLIVEGHRVWNEYQDLSYEDDDFEAIGKDFEKQTEEVMIGKVGLADTRLMKQRALVDFTEAWFKSKIV